MVCKTKLNDKAIVSWGKVKVCTASVSQQDIRALGHCFSFLIIPSIYGKENRKREEFYLLDPPNLLSRATVNLATEF